MYIMRARPKANWFVLKDGRIDFPAIFAHSRQAGIRHYVVERDDSADPFATLERSIAYLKKIKP
jgi:sugar phosphate isomerase/epimerase